MIRVARIIIDATLAFLFRTDFISIVRTSYFETFSSLLSLAVVLVAILLLLLLLLVVVVVVIVVVEIVVVVVVVH